MPDGFSENSAILIIVAATSGFIGGIYLNSICGVLLSLTVPIPVNYYLIKMIILWIMVIYMMD